VTGARFFNKNNLYLRMASLAEIVRTPGASMIDVRTTFEFQMGHVPGAVNIPLDEVPYRVNEIAALPSPRVLYCRSGNRSGIAVQMLRQAGLGDLYNGGGLYDMEIMLAGQAQGQR
jgi:phage shock protein E